MPSSYNELLADRAVSHAIALLRFEAQTRAEVLGYIRELEDRIEEILRLYRTGEISGSSRALRLEALQAQVRAAIGEAYGKAASVQESLLAGLARAESTFQIGLWSDVAVTAGIGLNFLSPAQARSIAQGVSISGAPSRGWWEAQAGDLLERFRREVDEGLSLGETTDEIVRRVRGTATGRRNTYEINGKVRTYVEFRGGVMDTSTRNARALVRSSVQAVASDARRETFLENQDVVKGIVQISTLDTRTTTTCIAYAGKAFALPDFQPIGHSLPYAGGTPRHWNCRSQEAALLKSWQELGINLQDVPNGARWSRLDGAVPGDFTMDDFLKRRTAAQVDAQLGKGVAELWRSGKIKLDDLVDRQSGRPLRLRDLEIRAGAAA